jgi:hypothetical protein
MPRKPTPPLVVEVVVETSPAAQAAYLEAIKILVRHIRATRQAGVEGTCEQAS